MNKEKSLTEGEALLLLVRRSGKSGVDIAKLLNIHPNHLSKLFKSARLSFKVKQRAAEVFNVPLSAFEISTPSDVFVPDVVQEPDPQYEKRKVEEMSAAEVMRYLEEKDKRHYEERGRLLAIIENLTITKPM